MSETEIDDTKSEYHPIWDRIDSIHEEAYQRVLQFKYRNGFPLVVMNKEGKVVHMYPKNNIPEKITIDMFEEREKK